MRKPTWTELVETATAPGNWSNADVAKFHYFNPNGLNAAKRETDKQISDAVKQGKCQGGAMLAYGTFNDFSQNALRDLAIECKAVKSAKLYVATNTLRDDIKKAELFLAGL